MSQNCRGCKAKDAEIERLVTMIDRLMGVTTLGEGPSGPSMFEQVEQAHEVEVANQDADKLREMGWVPMAEFQAAFRRTHLGPLWQIVPGDEEEAAPDGEG